MPAFNIDCSINKTGISCIVLEMSTSDEVYSLNYKCYLPGFIICEIATNIYNLGCFKNNGIVYTVRFNKNWLKAL